MPNTQNTQNQNTTNQNTNQNITPPTQANQNATTQNQTTQNQAQNQTPDQIKDELQKQIEQALQDNAAWKEHIRLSLVTINELFSSYKNLANTYKAALENIKKQETSLESTQEQVTKLYEETTKNLQSLQEKITQAKADINAQITQANSAANTTAENLRLSQETLKLIQQESDEFNEFKIATKETLEKLNLLINERAQIEKLADAIKTHMAQYLLEKEQAIRALLDKTQECKNDLEAKNNELKTALEGFKQSLEGDMQKTKEDILKDLQAFLDNVNKKIADLEQSFLEKQAKIDKTTEAITEFLEKLTAYKEEVRVIQQENLAELESKKQEKITEITAHTETKKQELDTFKEAKKGEIETFKGEKKEELKHETSNNLATLKLTKDEYLREINNTSIAQIAELKEMYWNVVENMQLFGSKYESITYTQNATFTPISGVSDYFVFLRGGTGGSWSGSGGGASNFGELLSANGGAGNTQGAGQHGEARSAFLRVENEVDIVISTGGLCIVSYPASMKFILDASFISAKDLEILSGSNDADVQKAWIEKNITNKQQQNYYAALVGMKIDIYPIVEADLPQIVDEKGVQIFASLRALELGIIEQYLKGQDDLQQIIDSYAVQVKSATTLQVKALENTTLEITKNATNDGIVITTSAGEGNYNLESQSQTWISFDKDTGNFSGANQGNVVFTFSAQEAGKNKTYRQVVVRSKRQGNAFVIEFINIGESYQKEIALEITTNAPDFSADSSSAHATFDKASKTITAASEGSANITISAQNTNSVRITKTLSAQVSTHTTQGALSLSDIKLEVSGF